MCGMGLLTPGIAPFRSDSSARDSVLVFLRCYVQLQLAPAGLASPPPTAPSLCLWSPKKTDAAITLLEGASFLEMWPPYTVFWFCSLVASEMVLRVGFLAAASAGAPLSSPLPLLGFLQVGGWFRNLPSVNKFQPGGEFCHTALDFEKDRAHAIS